jgi:hypothetical protein
LEKVKRKYSKKQAKTRRIQVRLPSQWINDRQTELQLKSYFL